MGMVDNWRRPDDTIWALSEAASPGGFMPHAKSTADLLTGLETERLLYRSDVAPVWYIIDRGRKELARLKEHEVNHGRDHKDR